MLNQQNSDRSQINKGKKRSIQFVISGGNPAKPFDFLKETLNENLSSLFLPIVLGMFATTLFFDEHKNDTLKKGIPDYSYKEGESL